MTRCPDTIHLAVDGGGTRCRIALNLGGKTHQVEVGAANVSTDFNAACVELQCGLALLADQAGFDPAEFERVPAYLGLAGITGQALADKLAAALPFRRVRIADDRPSALYGALGDRDGFVAHCGTGSFLAAKQAGKAQFAGGWGPVLGDQASAQWVGRLALSRTLDRTDGLTAPSALADQLLDRFGGSAGIIQAAANLSPTEFGALAPGVTEQAGQGDPIARSILQEAADYLSDRMSKMGWQPGLPICLTGGIAPCHAPYLPTEMQADLADPLGDPLSGALALARAFEEEIENERR
ncbi:BadF/BadG/BcrA/BcrD ATPase family protein [Ruegeria sp.]|uniref:BadF/BadG/BcrA/BcrD ATPase family protein n=1 Tax=Ruegeria sp. TaxID=1879320 RepID=UPI002321E773|nr:BadF/BadG/BcrA/BcrD ATPase family protein [Ruegeria sp.]MDA7965931.1 ATPase [Ruegeria sp.]